MTLGRRRGNAYEQPERLWLRLKRKRVLVRRQYRASRTVERNRARVLRLEAALHIVVSAVELA